MIEFELIDDSQTIDVNLIDDTEAIKVDIIKEIDKYSDLKELPSINDVTLIGNKTLHELGIQPEGDYATNTYVNTELNKKVDKVSGKGLSTNDYTTEEKTKLASLYNYDDSEIVSDIADLQNNKVDKVSGKGLSTNDFTNTYKTNVDNNTSARHTHSNKSVIDGISSTNISNWNNKAEVSDIPDVSQFITKDVSNLTYYTLKTNTGSLIDLEINTTNYVVTLSLKDQDGTVISTDSIDLPLESVVVGGSYDSVNQKIILTLENGNTVDIPVGALISGLQTEITSDNKLDSDLVDDSNSGNKFVTSSEKTTWNNKANTSDIPTKTSQLTNDSNFIVDANYVHTDNNFTNADVTKLSGIEAGAEVNVQANWNEASSSSDAYIQNKPYIPKYYYGTCSTKNSTRAKVVECEGFVLEEGATISVLFTNAQTYNGAPTLNVNGTGAVTVQYKSGTSGIRYMWNSGAVIDFTYNGTYWVMHRSDLATTTYYGITKLSESIVSTSAALGLTPSAMNKAMINIISGTPVYSSSATYDVGDKVRYTDNVWRCTTAISEAESWNEEHWEVVSPLQNQIDLKQATLVSGTNIKTINNTSLLGSGNIDIQGGGTTDYSDLTNKPSINNVTLSGNKTLSDLGIQPSGSYATTTDLATKQDITDNSLTTTNKTIPSAINEVNSIAKGANQALSYANYSAMVTAFNSLDDDEYNVGQNVYVVTTEVPDLWVSSVESTSSTYTYVDDATIVSALQTNGYIQVGYYKLSMLETQKVDLTGYQTKIDSSHKLSADLVDDANTTNKFVTSTDITNWNNKGTYSKPSGGIPSTDLDSAVQTSLGKADTSIQSLDSCISKDGGSAVQTISLTSGTGTTALSLKSMSSTSSYISFSNTNGWLASYGASSDRRPVFYNGTAYQLAYTTDIPKMVTLSQADYDDLVSGGTVDADTYYFIEE